MYMRIFTRCVLCLALASAARTAQPNIVFVLADDLGYHEISALGQRRYHTPNIDRLIREGMLFTDHYAGSPVCAPSRNSLMTGQHTGHLTVRNNFAGGGSSGDRVALKPTDVTLPERLRAAGYATGMVGKWGLGEDGSGSEPWNKGWDFFYGFVNQKHAHNQFPEFLYRNEVKEPIVSNYGHLRATFANDRFTEEAEQFLDRQRDSGRPFFLFVAYTTPHIELRCPADSLKEAEARHPALTAPGAPKSALPFAAMVMRLDRDVGRLISRLKDLGLEENTLVCFTSDNGPHDEGGKVNKYFQTPDALRGIKRDVYEGGIRVPFIARWPGRVSAGTQTAHLSAFWDFSATALELAGVTSTLPEEGVSFAPTLLGRHEQQEKHDYLYWEFVVDGEGRQAIRQGEWKAVRYGLGSRIELYNLDIDRQETRDLAAQHPDLIRHFSELLVNARIDDPLFPLAPSTGRR